MRPFIADHGLGGVRGVLEKVVARVGLAGFDGLYFTVNGDERVAQPVQFFHGFAFGWLDHHRAADGEGDGRGVETVVHQALGGVLDRHAFEAAEVNNTFVGDEAVFALVKNREKGSSRRAIWLALRMANLAARASPSPPMRAI